MSSRRTIPPRRRSHPAAITAQRTTVPEGVRRLAYNGRSRTQFIKYQASVPVMYRDAFVHLYTRNIEAGLHFYKELLE